MAKLDPKLQYLHKEVYSELLNQLDIDIITRIMQDPECEEAVLLNARVEREIRRQLEESLANS